MSARALESTSANISVSIPSPVTSVNVTLATSSCLIEKDVEVSQAIPKGNSFISCLTVRDIYVINQSEDFSQL